jgi:signal peptidase II
VYNGGATPDERVRRTNRHRGPSLRIKTDWHAITLFGIGILVLALDQWSKRRVRLTLPEGTSMAPFPRLERLFTFTHIHNTGVAFGLFPDRGILFVIVAIAVVIAIVLYYRRLSSSSWVLRVALGLQLGGASGNLVDRIARGYVTDFVNVRFFAIFNVADSALVVGAIMLGYYALFMERDAPAPAAEHADPPTPSPDQPAQGA